MEAESLEQMQARHRKEARDLQGRITNKKKNATKKTRRGVNDECAGMERLMRERHAAELGGRLQQGGAEDGDEDDAAPDGLAHDVAERLEETKLADPGGVPRSSGAPERNGNGGNSNSSAQPQQQQQQQQPPKKRNRQRERLARRAAEQEAAAAAAEAEAATMTDHRAAERTAMLREFAAHGLEEKEVRPDGHCLFSAVADQLAQSGIPLAPPGPPGESNNNGGGGDSGDGDEPPYRAVRRAAAGYMAGHGDDFAGFLEEPLGSYVAKVRDTAEWGGQLELAALASAYRVEIRVVQDGETQVIGPAAAAAAAGEGDPPERRIWLAYYRHGYGLGEHYNSLRRKEEA